MTGNKMNVLVIDDEQLVCDFIISGLTESGYMCTAATDAAIACDNISRQHFDVILLDIRLPGLSGIEMLRRGCLNLSSTVAIMITGVNDIDTAVETLKLGVSDYLVKPFTIDKVVGSITAALKSRAKGSSFSEMDAIAQGIEANTNPSYSRLQMVTPKTIEISRRLGIPESEIQIWVAARTKFHLDTGKLLDLLQVGEVTVR